jgi:hypothetical protein
MIEIPGRMDQEDVLVRRRPGSEEVVLAGAHREQVLIDEPELLKGKDVLPGVEHPVFVAVNELEGEPLPDEGLQEVDEIAHEKLTIPKISAGVNNQGLGIEMAGEPGYDDAG